MSAPALLLVNCPEPLQQPLRQALLDHGMVLAEAALAPALVVAWLDPRAPETPAEVATLQRRQGGAPPAVLLVGTDAGAEAFAAAAEAGADGYSAASEAAVIAAQCQLLLGCRARFAEASPLTGLPGNNALQREIERRLPERGKLAVLAFDVDNFKSYNDAYGYQQGDALLRHTCGAVLQALAERATPGWFAAHLGGDDFFALIGPPEAEPVATRAIALFAAGLASLYAPADFARGSIRVHDRAGQVREMPLATLTVAEVTNEADDLVHAGQLAAVLAELKAYGKPLAGSNYVPDRRRDHGPAKAFLAGQPEGEADGEDTLRG
jgi:diguanylate cyclase (GGDEF)-like protein